MTGPNPDAELDEALGVAQLPPALPGPTDHELAGRLVETWRSVRGSYADRAEADEALVNWFAEALATERMRATARVLATQAVAGTAPPVCPPHVPDWAPDRAGLCARCSVPLPTF